MMLMLFSNTADHLPIKEESAVSEYDGAEVVAVVSINIRITSYNCKTNLMTPSRHTIFG